MQFSPDQMLPAAGQGVIGIECLAHNEQVRETVSQLQDSASWTTTRAERAVTHSLQANCSSPVASFAHMTDGTIKLHALVAAPDGSTVIRESATADVADAEQLGGMLAQRLLEQGAAQFLV